MILAAVLLGAAALGAWIGWAVGCWLERRPEDPPPPQPDRPLGLPREALRSGAASGLPAPFDPPAGAQSAWDAIATERAAVGGSIGGTST